MIRRLFLFLLLFTIAGLAQEPPKAILVDEFGAISCEDLLSRFDAFIVELNNNPQDIGYILIADSGRNPKGFFKFVEASMYMRRFDREKVTLSMIKSDGSKVNGQFWRVPMGAEPPPFTVSGQPGTDLTKSFIYGSDIAENICPTFSPDLYAKTILDNPGSRARVVIAASTVRERLDLADTVRDLLQQNNVPLDRISLYFVHKPKQSYSEVEYWFIPGKRP